LNKIKTSFEVALSINKNMHGGSNPMALELYGLLGYLLLEMK